LTDEQTKQFFTKLGTQLDSLFQLQAKAKAENVLEMPDLILNLDKFTNSSPNSLTRLVYEQVIMSDTQILGAHTIEDFTQGYICQVNPFITKYIDDEIWLAY